MIDLKNPNKKIPLYLLLIYTAAQLLPAIAAEQLSGNLQLYMQIYGTMAAFLIGAASMIWLTSKYDYRNPLDEPGAVPIPQVILWGVAGMVMAVVAQNIAFNLELLIFGTMPESANTQKLVLVTQNYPLFLFVVAVAGPIMEEFIFRKILFGMLTERTGVIGAAVISSLVFAFFHMDGHILVYSSMGFVFCYLYYKTKSLTAPMIAHCLMNLTAVALPLLSNHYGL